MARESCCCFTGHRILGGDFSRDVLLRGIEYLIGQGVDTFICGGALGFDTVCAKAVLDVKKEHPHIKLWIFAPCSNQDAKWSISDSLTYKEILKRADFVDMPAQPYFADCMKLRNYKMVDNSAYCICYMNSSRSGTGQTYRYATAKGLTIYNISGKS